MTTANVEHKAVPVAQVKVVDEVEGIVSTLVSVTGVVDDVKDNINPGAYAKTLVARTPKGVWSHDWDQPVSKTLAADELMPGDDRLPTKQRGGAEWPKEAGGLLIQTQFNLKTQRGREAFEDVVFFGDEQEWSIGYAVPVGGAKIDPKTGVRDIKEIELFEYSPVLFGAMSLTATMGVKDAQEAWRAQHEVADAAEALLKAVDPSRLVVKDAAPEPEPVAEPEVEADPKAAAEPTKATVCDDPVDDGTGTCSNCGEPMADHVVEEKVEKDADADPEVKEGESDPTYEVVQDSETGWEVVDGDGQTVKAFETQEDAVAHVEELLAPVKAAAAALEAEAAQKAAIASALADFDVDDETRAKMAEALLAKLAPPVEQKAYLELPGSYEARQEALWRYTRNFSPPEEDVNTDPEAWFDPDDGGYYDAYWGCWDRNSWTSIEATFDDRVVLAYYEYDSEPDEPSTRYFQVPYSFDETAQTATITGVPVEVTISATVAAKSLARAKRVRQAQKVGRTLSSGSADLVTTAVESLVELLGQAGVDNPWSPEAEEALTTASAEPAVALEPGLVRLEGLELMLGKALAIGAEVA